MSTLAQRIATVSVTVGDAEITFESGKLAKQADGSVVVRSGETMVLATAVGRMEPREGADFFPLTIDVEERMYAAGKIPGGFFKREGRPSERAILTARMTDRPIRPLWPKGFKNEVQVIATVLSADMVTPHDILCINGASAALMVSSMPFLGPVGAVRVGRIDEQLVFNPTLPAMQESTLDLIVVGTKDGLTMIEAGAEEIPEDVLLEAFELAHREIIRICEAQEDLRSQIGKPKYLDPEVTQELEGQVADRIRARIQEAGLREGGAIVEELIDELSPALSMDSGEEDILRRTQVKSSLAQILDKVRHEAVVGTRLRAVRRRPPCADRRGAGFEGAEVREAAPALRANRGDRRSRLPGRPRNGRRRRSAGEGRPHAPVREARVRGDLQGDRAQEDRGREEPARRS